MIINEVWYARTSQNREFSIESFGRRDAKNIRTVPLLWEISSLLPVCGWSFHMHTPNSPFSLSCSLFLLSKSPSFMHNLHCGIQGIVCDINAGISVSSNMKIVILHPYQVYLTRSTSNNLRFRIKHCPTFCKFRLCSVALKYESGSSCAGHLCHIGNHITSLSF